MGGKRETGKRGNGEVWKAKRNLTEFRVAERDARITLV